MLVGKISTLKMHSVATERGESQHEHLSVRREITKIDASVCLKQGMQYDILLEDSKIKVKSDTIFESTIIILLRP